MRPFAAPALLLPCLLMAACGSAGAQVPPAEPPPVPAGLPASVAPTPVAVAPPTAPAASTAPAAPARPRTRSRALGRPEHGRLSGGVQLAEAGPDWVTWDPVLKRAPNRPWRRWGTEALVSTLQRVLAEYRVAHPQAPAVLVGDLSRPHGGVFDNRYGGLGHASHQNGLDVDVMYPRRDGRLRHAWRPDQVDRVLAQDLVDRFVAAGARYVFVGLRTRMRGPRAVVQAIPHHDDHMHVRIRRPRAGGAG
jgi:murein endopeptidase